MIICYAKCDDWNVALILYQLDSRRKHYKTTRRQYCCMRKGLSSLFRRLGKFRRHGGGSRLEVGAALCLEPGNDDLSRPFASGCMSAFRLFRLSAALGSRSCWMLCILAWQRWPLAVLRALVWRCRCLCCLGNVSAVSMVPCWWPNPTSELSCMVSTRWCPNPIVCCLLFSLVRTASSLLI
jgi:hypothetical protein